MTMHTVHRSTLISLIALCAACSGESSDAGTEFPAELVFRGGGVYTVNPEQPWAESVAIDAGRIIAVGTDEQVGSRIGASTRIVDLDGKMLLPAFGDSHVHPFNYPRCDLNGILELEELIETIRGCASAADAGAWIRGGGWFLYLFEDGNPNKSLLGELAPGHPVLLSSGDGHSSWASSAALEIAGIDSTTADPVNGRIERDPSTGEPSGTLRESASRLVSAHIPAYTPADRVEALRRGIELANSLGITSYQDASGSRQSLQAYAALDSRGELNIRATVALRANLAEGVEDLPRLEQLRDEFTGEQVRATAVKIGADGGLEPYTAPLLEPYSDRPGFYGEPNIPPEALNELVAALDAAGFQVHVHAMGDATMRMTLDAFEQARSINGVRDARHHIAHAQLIHPDDHGRFRELEVIANFQPLWAQRDGYIIDLTEPRLGPERSRWLYPIGSIAAAGARLAFGSDWPVSSMNPLDILQVAVTRARFTTYRQAGEPPPAQADGSGPSWIPEERIDLETALAAYTAGVAHLNFQETQIGTIEAGKYADLVVLDRNLFEIPANKIHEASVVLTLLAGRTVYDRDNDR